ncbi:hypothetical protein MNEG_3674, partial [Monoraphidium neglectum]
MVALAPTAAGKPGGVSSGQVAVAVLALVAMFMLGRRMGGGRLDDGAEPGTAIQPWYGAAGGWVAATGSALSEESTACMGQAESLSASV